MKSTHKAVAAYFTVLAAMGLAVWQPSFAWLPPVSLLILPMVLVIAQAISGWITWAPASRSMASFAIIVFSAIVKTAFMVAFEELVFRGYFLQRFSFSFGIRFAVLSSSVLLQFHRLQ